MITRRTQGRPIARSNNECACDKPGTRLAVQVAYAKAVQEQVHGFVQAQAFFPGFLYYTPQDV
jgi:hypothetical protein